MRKSSLFLFVIVLSFASCDVNVDIVTDDISQKRLRFSSFGFRAEDNIELASDYIIDNANCDTLCFFIQELNNVSFLIPSFSCEYIIAKVEETIVESGNCAQDFNSIVKFNLEDKSGHRDSCFVKVVCANGIPIINIKTEGNAEIISKEDYINAKIRINNCPEFGVIDTNCSVRGRGNATWMRYPQKPYKIKFEKKQAPFGFQSDKDFVLLADFTDKSLMRTAYMFEIAQAVGLEDVLKYKHVEVILNSDYLGTYVFTEQVEKDRVEIDDDGFIIEEDTYFAEEPYYFTSKHFKKNYTFKYPKVNRENNDSRYIQSYIDNLEDALLQLKDDVNNSYVFELIDIVSFAKWHIVSEITGNLDPNIYYTLPSRGGKLKMGPIWDAEWSLGLACKGNPNNPYGWFFWSSQHAPMGPMEEFWNKEGYFKYLFSSPIFKECVKAQWSNCKESLKEKQCYLKNLASSLLFTQHHNFERWPMLDEHSGGTLIICGGWKEEVDYVERWLSDRIEWFNDFVVNL